MTVALRSWKAGLAGLALFALGLGTGLLVGQPPRSAAPPAERRGPETRLLTEAWNTIRNHFVDQPGTHTRAYTYAAIKGMVAALGDSEHSQFLPPDRRREETEELDGAFSGIGVRLRDAGSRVVIDSLYDDAPAQRQGLRPDDAILAVGRQRVAGMAADQVQEAVRGPAGSRVQLVVRQHATGALRHLTLVRERLGTSSVSYAMLPGRVALIRVAVFSAGTDDGVGRALTAAGRQGAGALILDLRDNPGGYVDEAVAVASRFLTGGNVALERDAHGQVTPLAVASGGVKNVLPLVLLINHETASAAEIVAGALRDHGRAILVGTTSFGAGSVLEEHALSDGSSLMLAVMEWLTPAGQPVWHRGIAPDRAVALAAGAEALTPKQAAALSEAQIGRRGDRQLVRALDILHGGRTGASP